MYFHERARFFLTPGPLTLNPKTGLLSAFLFFTMSNAKPLDTLFVF
jgi:hypothetical protein